MADIAARTTAMQSRQFQRIGIITLLVILAAPFAGFVFYSQWRPSLEAWTPYRVKNSAAPSPAGLTLTWLGAAGVAVSDGETTILVDPFFSRPPLQRVLFGELQPDPARIRNGLQRAGLKRADALVVTHTHYDHVLDVPWLARHFNAPVLGSASAAEVARGQGLAEPLIREVQAGDRMRVGRFRLRFLGSDHVPLPPLLARVMGTDGAIERPLIVPAPVNAWQEGRQLALHLSHPDGSVAILGSAGHQPGMANDLRADVVLAAVAALGKQGRDYHDAFVRHGIEAFRPDQVVPLHWDDFFQPLSRSTPPLSLLMENVPAALRAIERPLARAEDRFRIVRPLEPVRLDRTGEQMRLKRLPGP